MTAEPRATTKVFRITVEELEEGTSETVEIPQGEYFIVTTLPCHIAHTQIFGGGKTIQLTIKGRTQP